MTLPRNVVHLSQDDVDNGRIYHVTLGEKLLLQGLISELVISGSGFHVNGGTLSGDGSGALYFVPDDGSTPLIISMF